MKKLSSVFLSIFWVLWSLSFLCSFSFPRLIEESPFYSTHTFSKVAALKPLQPSHEIACFIRLLSNEREGFFSSPAKKQGAATKESTILVIFLASFPFYLDWKPLGSYQFYRLNILSSQAHPPTI